MSRYLIITLVFLYNSLSAQDHTEIAGYKTGELPQAKLDIPGLWLVNEVTVGEESLTPTAKWFLFEADGTQTSGNGWVQNFLGTWYYNATTRKFLSYDQEGKADEYGAFDLSYNGEKMIWQRTEDGVPVKVTLSPITEKPLAPWDKITGNWTFYKLEITDSATNEGFIADVGPFSFLFGWDRRYRKFDGNGKRIETGIWHIEAHSNWLWTISDADNNKTGYGLEFDESGMIFTLKTDKVTEKRYFKRE
jgi:hypothetical protein